MQGSTGVAARQEERKLLGAPTRELLGAAKQAEGTRAMTEAGSYFLLHDGDELLLYGVRAENQTQVGLALGVTTGSHHSWRGEGYCWATNTFHFITKHGGIKGPLMAT